MIERRMCSLEFGLIYFPNEVELVTVLKSKRTLSLRFSNILEITKGVYFIISTL